MKFKHALTFVLLLTYIVSYTQENLEQTPGINKLKLFIEGDEIEGDDDLEFNYLRESIDFADFVNDPKMSDVHIIVIKEITGSGGFKYSLWFNNLKFNNIQGYTLNVNTESGETIHNSREFISNSIIKGLMPFLNETNEGNNYKLSLIKNNKDSLNNITVNDNWNFWMFELTGWGWYSFRENREGYDYVIEFDGDKITNDIKIENKVFLKKEIESIQSGIEKAKKRSVYNYVSSRMVYSLNDKWSCGVAAYSYSRTSRNTKLFYSGSLAAEYNFFPWEYSNKKIISIIYQAGFEQYYYNETTFRNLNNEFLPVHKLRVKTKMVQPWGGITANVTASQYLSDFSLYSLSFNSIFSFKIAKGLTLDFSFSASSFHDQLYYSAGYYSIEDVILGNIEIPSSVAIDTNIGITYRFGSIYNNIVNRRM